MILGAILVIGALAAATLIKAQGGEEPRPVPIRIKARDGRNAQDH